MTAVSSVSSNNSVASLLASSSGDIMAKAMAVLMTRYDSLKGDLATQIADIESRNATKRLWNDQLVKLNKMMEDVAAAGKESSKTVEIYVSAEDFPYKDYRATTGPDGTPQLVPTSTADSNKLCTGDNCVPVYDLADAAAKVGVAQLVGEAKAAELRLKDPLLAHFVDASKAGVVATREPLGYNIKVSADQLKAATDNVRAQLDNLNTENEVGMLRLNDTFSKSNLALEQMGKLLNGQNETASKLLANF
jgi:hypothetical protein